MYLNLARKIIKTRRRLAMHGINRRITRIDMQELEGEEKPGEPAPKERTYIPKTKRIKKTEKT